MAQSSPDPSWPCPTQSRRRPNCWATNPGRSDRSIAKARNRFGWVGTKSLSLVTKSRRRPSGRSGPKAIPSIFSGERRPGQPERGIEEVEEQGLGDRRHAGRRSRLRQRLDRPDVARPGDVDVEDLLERGGGPGVAVTLDDQELVVVDREDLVDAVSLVVELVEELPDRAALHIDLDAPIARAA